MGVTAKNHHHLYSHSFIPSSTTTTTILFSFITTPYTYTLLYTLICNPSQIKKTIDTTYFKKLATHACLFVIVCNSSATLFFVSGVTVLLSLTVFSIMVTEMLPKVSDAVPILG